MIKAIIIDDENLAREVIKEYLEDLDNIELIGEYPDGFSGLKAIQELKPDLVFLDIQMPKLTGFELLEVLEEKPGIIFTTAYDQYAIKAFELNAVDYLLKPFGKDRFDTAINKFMESNTQSHNKSVDSLEKNFENENEIIHRVVVKMRNEIRIFPTEQIVYIEAQDDYVMIYLSDTKFLKQKTMTYFENHLDVHFFVRVHRSYIVKIDQILKIEAYEKSASIIILKDGRKVPVSRSGLSKLKNVLGI